jgi:Icc-related predicted phosphoesterase
MAFPDEIEAAWASFPDEHARNPDKAWSILQKWQTVKRLPIPDPAVETPPGTLRVVAISDTHTLTPGMGEIPMGDVLIHAGDFTSNGANREVRNFVEFMQSQPHKHKIVIAGNHDRTFDEAFMEKHNTTARFVTDYKPIKAQLVEAEGITYLEDSHVTIDGVKFYGSPYSSEFGYWAFMVKRGEESKKKWAEIPDDVDVLITHGPAIGHGDKTNGYFGAVRAGCVDLLRVIQTRVKPKYHVFGHIHEDYGITTDGQTVYVNAATCDSSYVPNHGPIVLDIPIPE